MLLLDNPIGPIRGLTVYRDTDPDTFHFINERPRLARNDGVPEFVFLEYQRDVTDNPNFDPDAKQALGGGFLAFTVDLSVDEDVRKDVINQLSGLADGTANLGPVQFTKGSVRLSISDDIAKQPDAPAGQASGVSFFEKVYGTTMPSMVGDNRATFGVVLDAEGAALMKAALQSGVSPIGVIYQLDYLGLRPAFDVKVHADYHRVYDDLELQFGLRGGYGPISAAVEIDAAFQKLRDSGAVKVEVINFTDDADLRGQADDAFNFFKTEMLHDFFQSSMPPPSLQSAGSGGGLLGQLQTQLNGLTQGQTGSAAPTRGQPTTLAPTPAPAAGNLSSNVTPTATANSTSTAAASGAPTGGGAAGGAPFGIQLGFTLRKLEAEELKQRDYEYSMQAAVSRTAAPQGLFSTMVGGLDLSRAIRTISLDDDWLKRMVTTATLAGDLTAEGLAAVTVNVEYPGVRPANVDPSYTDGTTWTPGHTDAKTFTTFLDARKTLAYRAKVEVQFDPNGPWDGDELHYSSDWVTHTERSLQVDPFSAVDRFDLEVGLGRVGEEVEQVEVEVAYHDPATGFTAARTLTFPRNAPSQHWKLRFAETQVKTFRSRVSYFLADNVVHRTEWVESEGITTEAATLVVNDPFVGAPIRFRVVPLLDVNSLVEADLDVFYKESGTGYEHRESVQFLGTVGGGNVPLTGRAVTIPTIAPETSTATYQLVVVRADGSSFDSGELPLARDTGVLLASDGAGATHRITIHLASTDLAAVGLAALRVRLRATGPDGDNGDVLFLSGQTADRVLTLVQPTTADPFSYHWEVEGYTAQGLPRAGATGTGSDTTLIVGLPTT